MRRYFLSLLLAMGLLCGEEPQKWVVYYAQEAQIADFEPYKLVALDADNHPSVGALKERGKTVLGYISLGEVEDFRPYFEQVKKEGILGEENENWPGSYFVDMRNPLWAKRVIEKLIPYILHQGFDGLIFDTVDNAEAMEEMNGTKYQGMVDGAAQLIQAIRLHYPTIPIMMNRGYATLPKVADSIDMILAEDMMTSYNFKEKKYTLLPQTQVEENAKTVEAAKEINPTLEVYTLDYWDPADPEQIKKIYAQLREAGYIPYVGTIKLNKIIPEPK